MFQGSLSICVFDTRVRRYICIYGHAEEKRVGGGKSTDRHEKKVVEEKKSFPTVEKRDGDGCESAQESGAERKGLV